MSNIIKFLFNIEDKYLRFDKKIPFEECNGYKIAHLVQSYEMKCPICKRKMLKNSFKVIKKQKYLYKPLADCPRTVTKIAEVKGV